MLTPIKRNHSTTRLLRQVPASEVEAEIQAAHKPEDKFETMLFLPEGEGRKGEGGLRTQGYFKQSQADKPLISVVTVVYNGEQFLEETILSVINQTYDNVEYIIIDGGSTDGTLDIIKKYDHAIDYWVSENDKGIYDAMNKGICVSLGQVVSILNCADLFLTDALSEVSIFFSSDKKLSVLTGAIIKYDNFHEFNLYTDEENFNSLINYTMPCNHPATFVPLKVYKCFGLFNSFFKICGDYDLIYRFHFSGVKFYHSDFLFVRMQLGGVSEKYDSVFKRSIEHFIIRKNRINFALNFSQALRLYIVESVKFLLKVLVGKKVLFVYRKLRHK